MHDIPYLEKLDPQERDFAEQALALLAFSDEAGDSFAPATWHLVGRHAYYSLGAASAAVDALLHEGNAGMDLDALRAIADVLRQAVIAAGHAVGEAPT